MTIDSNASDESLQPVDRAQFEQLEVIAATLANSFAMTPLFRWLLTNRDDVEAALVGTFAAQLRIELAKSDHIVDVVDGGAGVALWFGIDRWRQSKLESARLLPSAVETYGGRLRIAGKVRAMIEEAHPIEPHRHLAYIGVQDQRQGAGLGSMMLRAATERCDADGVAAYLENLDPRNAPLYQRFGFVDRGPIPLPNGAPVVTAMWRDPS